VRNLVREWKVQTEIRMGENSRNENGEERINEALGVRRKDK
jgi:hypothetical protein